MPNHLTFVINPANDVSSIALLSRALVDITRLLRDVDRAIHGGDHKAGWRVLNIQSSAPTITVTPNGADKRAVRVIGDGIRIVTEGTGQPPQYFTGQAIASLTTMGRLFKGRDAALSIAVWTDGEQTASIDARTADQAKRIASAVLHNLGSLQGKLEAINVHETRTATIWDSVSRAPVHWEFGDEDTERVVGLLEKLVMVTGDIAYASNGKPRSISNVIAIEDATPVQHTERAEFGSIPDQRVKELGAAEWLRRVREGGGV